MKIKRHFHKCYKRYKGFAIRAGIISIAFVAVLVVALGTGEEVTLSTAIQRITEALGFAVADTLAD